MPAFFITNRLELVQPTLDTIVECDDAFPPLRDAVSNALWIISTAKSFSISRNEWQSLSDLVGQSTACVVAAVVRAGNPFLFNNRLIQLTITLKQFQPIVTESLETSLSASSSKVKQLGYSMKLLMTMADLKSRLNRALAQFELGSTLASRNELVSLLSETDIIRMKAGDIKYHGEIISFAQRTLSNIGDTRRLGIDWPGEAKCELFIREAGGVMLWAETACRFLQNCSEPKTEFRLLLRSCSGSFPTTETRMRQLYRAIISSCPWGAHWEERNFRRNFEAVVGAIISLKRPLSASQINSLVEISPSDPTIPCMRATGIIFENDDGLTVHESFRTFASESLRITLPSQSGGTVTRCYYFDEARNNQRLAYNTLRVLNRELPQLALALDNIMTILDQSTPQDIPPPPAHVVSDLVWYSCQFFVAHLSTVIAPDPRLLDALHEFCSQNLHLWMALCASKGAFQGISAIVTWSRNVAFPLESTIHNEELCQRLQKMALHLKHMHRSREARDARRDYRVWYRKTTKEGVASFNNGVASVPAKS